MSEARCIKCKKSADELRVIIEFTVPADSRLAKEIAAAENRAPKAEIISICSRCFCKPAKNPTSDEKVDNSKKTMAESPQAQSLWQNKL